MDCGPVCWAALEISTYGISDEKFSGFLKPHDQYSGELFAQRGNGEFRILAIGEFFCEVGESVCMLKDDLIVAGDEYRSAKMAVLDLRVHERVEVVACLMHRATP
jgi:hypothetical protein